MDENKIKFLKTVNRDHQIINPDNLEIAASKLFDKICSETPV